MKLQERLGFFPPRRAQRNRSLAVRWSPLQRGRSTQSASISSSTTVLQTKNAAKRACGKLVEDVARDGDAECGDGCRIMPCVTNRRRRAGGTSGEFWVRVV